MMDASEATTRDLTQNGSRFSNVLGNATGVLSAGAGAIHFAVIQSHYEEYWAFGVFFATAAWLQILWAMLVVARPGRGAAITGIAINGAITVVWIVSRTVGIPFGPEPGVAEAVEFVDVAATSLQVLSILGCLGLLFTGAGRAVARRAVVSSTLVLGLSVAVLTTAAIISFTPHEEEEEAPAEHEEEEGEAGAALGNTVGLTRLTGQGVEST
jgi:hypothetical protein